MDRKINVSIIGTVGIPAKYGGFETLTENLIVGKMSEDINYTVYCSSIAYDTHNEMYHGASLKYISLSANGSHSVLYDYISILKSWRRYDVLLILGVSGCTILPFLKWMIKGKVIVNIDGLEHRRDKWSPFVRKFLKLSEWCAIKFSDIIITDNKGIKDYVQDEYNAISAMIPYGGDHVLCSDSSLDILTSYHLCPMAYSMGVCRIEPENNVAMILESFSQINIPLIFIGNWMNSDYGKVLWEQYKNHSTIKLLPPIYDLSILNVLRSNCEYYLHGHSAGGTNPSLVEAMFYGRPILAFDCVYNRETTENKALYFTDSYILYRQIMNANKTKMEFIGMNMLEIAERRYTWSLIVSEYEKLYKY